MNYIQQMNLFLSKSKYLLNSNEVHVYLRLFELNNELAWKEWFSIDDDRLGYICGVHRHTITKIRNNLRQKGFIEFKSGKRGVSTQYKIIELCTMNGQSVVQSVVQSVGQSVGQSIGQSVGQSVGHLDKQETKDLRDIPPISPSGGEVETTAPARPKKSRQKSESAAASFSEVEGSAEYLQALRDFAEMRKLIKKPLSQRAVELLLKKLDSMAQDEATKIAILNESTLNEWQGVYPLKGARNEYGAGRGHPPAVSAEQQAYYDELQQWQERKQAGIDVQAEYAKALERQQQEQCAGTQSGL